MMKAPDECGSLEEIRAEIDRLDREVIAALGKRFAYVKAAAKFKTSEAGVKVPERFASMLRQRRLWAEEEGLNPDAVEKFYRDLVSYFIEEELKQWKRRAGETGPSLADTAELTWERGMIARTPLEAVEQLDEAFNRGDIEAVLAFYENAATMVVEPGRLATGKAALRAAFEVILGFKGAARQVKTHVIEAGDVALFTSKWSFSGTAPDGTPISRESYASTIFRKQADGGWRIVVDNSWGPAVLE